MQDRRAKPYFSAELLKRKARKVPIYSVNDLKKGYKESEKLDFIELPSMITANFAIRMPDETMDPEFQQDDILFISNYGNYSRAAHLLVIRDFEDIECTVRYIRDYYYMPDIEIFGVKARSAWINRNDVKSLGQVVWRQRDY